MVRKPTVDGEKLFKACTIALGGLLVQFTKVETTRAVEHSLENIFKRFRLND